MHKLLTRALMALASLLSSHRDAIATIAFLQDDQAQKAKAISRAAYDIYTLSQRLACARIDNETDDGSVLLTADHLKDLRRECDKIHAAIDTLRNEKRPQYHGPGIGLLSWQQGDPQTGDLLGYRRIHDATVDSWNSIRQEMDPL